MSSSMRPTPTDLAYMNRALTLACRAINPSPNPAVGALVVKGKKIIAYGWHEKAGLPHAEAIALKRAGKRARGATLIVTLEPCRHTGRTPPCIDAILKSGVTRVVVGMRDPTTHGGGVKILERNDIKVVVGVRETECRLLNQIWLKNVTRHLPYVTLKLAFDAAGSTIPPAGKKWITGAAARQRVQKIRREHDAILVGVGTVITDDPHLTVRGKKIRMQPTRVILDPYGRVPRNAKLFHEAGTTIVVTRKKIQLPRGSENLVVPHFKLTTILKKLAARGLTSILVEGGATTAHTFLQAEFVDAVAFFTTPGAPMHPQFLGRKWKLQNATRTNIGRDTLHAGLLRMYG